MAFIFVRPPLTPPVTKEIAEKIVADDSRMEYAFVVVRETSQKKLYIAGGFPVANVSKAIASIKPKLEDVVAIYLGNEKETNVFVTPDKRTYKMIGGVKWSVCDNVIMAERSLASHLVESISHEPMMSNIGDEGVGALLSAAIYDNATFVTTGNASAVLCPSQWRKITSKGIVDGVATKYVSLYDAKTTVIKAADTGNVKTIVIDGGKPTTDAVAGVSGAKNLSDNTTAASIVTGTAGHTTNTPNGDAAYPKCPKCNDMSFAVHLDSGVFMCAKCNVLYSVDDKDTAVEVLTPSFRVGMVIDMINKRRRNIAQN